jgi:hypothetical protein
MAARSSFASLPVEFEENQGQHDPAIRYLARARGYQMYLTSDGPVIVFSRSKPSDDVKRSAIQMRFGGANETPELVGQERSEHKTNYFVGDHPSDYRTDIPNYARVLYRQVYPGIDVAFYGRNGAVEYDLLLRPGADPGRIEMDFAGAEKLELDASGDLLIHTGAGVLTQHRPAVFQERDGAREAVAADYRVVDGNKVRLQVASYDPGRTLTVDPILSYSTYIGSFNGGSSDLRGVAVDPAGNAYVVGTTAATDWPVASAYQSSRAGANDIVVAKINPQGTGLVYSTYLGGRNSNSSANAISIDASGNAYIAGTTTSNSYPTTKNVFSGAINGGGAVVTKLNAAGNGLVFSTYLKNAGGTPYGVASDSSGNVVVAGTTRSGTLTTTSGALQTTTGATTTGFISKLSPTGSALVFSTYLGGSVNDNVNGLALDPSGNIYVTGDTASNNFPVTAGAFQSTTPGPHPAFVAKINPTGTTMLYGTFLGGNSFDMGLAIAVDAGGRAFVTGNTESVDFPIRNGRGWGVSNPNFSVSFISVLNADGAGLYWSTLFGGNGCLTSTVTSCTYYGWMDRGMGIAVDSSGTNVYAVGFLSSIEGVNLYDPIQSVLNGSSDAFVVHLQQDALTPNLFNTRYATRLGGTSGDVANAVAIDGQGNVYVVGGNNAGSANGGLSGDFPTTKGAYRVSWTQGPETFVFKLSTLNSPVTLAGDCPATPGDPARLRASTALNATGNVTFKDTSTTLATVPIAAGVAAWSGSLPAGVHAFTATRSSDGAVSQLMPCLINQ